MPASASLATVADYDAQHPELSNVLSPGVAPTTGSATTPYWLVAADIRADEITVETADAHWDESLADNPHGFGSASPNIIQQGKASANGQWKLSQHPRRGTARQFTVSCDFQDAAHSSRTVGMGAGLTLATGTDFHIICALLPGGVPQLTILAGDRQVDSETATGYPPVAYVVNPTDDVFFGKKSSQRCPAEASNTHANDAYAGYLDNIEIQTSHW